MKYFIGAVMGICLTVASMLITYSGSKNTSSGYLTSFDYFVACGSYIYYDDGKMIITEDYRPDYKGFYWHSECERNPS